MQMFTYPSMSFNSGMIFPEKEMTSARMYFKSMFNDKSPMSNKHVSYTTNPVDGALFPWHCNQGSNLVCVNLGKPDKASWTMVRLAREQREQREGSTLAVKVFEVLITEA